MWLSNFKSLGTLRTETLSEVLLEDGIIISFLGFSPAITSLKERNKAYYR